LQQRPAGGGDLHGFPQLEGVIVGDDDHGALDVAQHVARHDLAAGVVAVWVLQQQHAQAILDGQARRDQQEATREFFAVWAAHSVNSLPRDDHRHHRGLARTSSQLQSQAH